MLYHHHPMPHDRGKQRGKAVVADGETDGHSGGQHAAPRKLTAVACIDCRKRKRKCNGERPSCSACQTRGLSCTYDVVEGATRTEDLKQKVSSLSLRVRNLELFVNKLRYSTDNEASAILAQLRLGDTVDGILGADMADGLSDMGEVDQVMEQAAPTFQSASTLGIGLARNSAGPSLLTKVSLHDSSPKERSLSVGISSPGLIDGVKVEPSTPQQNHSASPWAHPLFIEVDSQHLLFKDDPYQNIQSPNQEPSPVLDGNTSDSTYLTSNHTKLWIDPTLSSSRPDSSSDPVPSVLDGRAKGLDGHKARRDQFNDARPAGDSVTISSNLFSPVATAPLSLPLTPQMLGVDLTAPSWAIASMYLNEDLDMMSTVYVNFINEAKGLITSGVAPDRLFGVLPDVEALVNEAAYQRSSFLSQWTARLANSFGMPTLSCRMAVMWLHWLLMRWIIHPTPATYLAIPDWYKPTPYQMIVPHPVYVDFQIWPRLRDAVIQRVDLQCQPLYWYSEAATTIDCNWPGSDQDAVSYDLNARMTLSASFVQHLMDLGNWSVGPVIRKHIPDACTILQIKYGPM